MDEQIYKIENVKSFEPVHIFDCGQCFRWDIQPDGSYTGVFKENVMNVKKEGNTVIFKGICNGDIREICIDYFDLERNYEEIKEQLSKIDNNVKTSVVYGSGIRILNQDLWETIISFIISANNNIPRIKGIINRISKKYGKEIEWNGNKYYTFPTVEELAKQLGRYYYIKVNSQEGEEVYTTQHIQQTLMQICQNYQKQDLDILDMTVNRGTLEQHFLEVARRNEI